MRVHMYCRITTRVTLARGSQAADTYHCLQSIPSPPNHAMTAQHVLDEAVSKQCDAIVVGIPLDAGHAAHDKQADSFEGRRCRNFALTLAMVASGHQLKVFLMNERSSTKEATARMRLSGCQPEYVQV